MTLVTVLFLVFYFDYVMEGLKTYFSSAKSFKTGNCKSKPVQYRVVGRRGRVSCYAAEPILYLPKII